MCVTDVAAGEMGVAGVTVGESVGVAGVAAGVEAVVAGVAAGGG